MKIKVKIPAKINLTLDVTGVSGGYHMLNSLVTSVNLFDEVILRPRKDDEVNVRFYGLPVGVEGKDSNAYKAAKLFLNEFPSRGADIEVKRNIPAGGGLGGSSADVAGVLLGMKRLYGVAKDMTAFANSLGSDTAYMLDGGYAVLSGRGDKITRLPDVKQRFYLLIIMGDCGVSTAQCFAEFDRRGVFGKPHTEVAARLLSEGDVENFLRFLNNDLYGSAVTLLPEIGTNLNALKPYGCANMTGSGSAVYGIYATKRERDIVYKALLPRYGRRLVCANTI